MATNNLSLLRNFLNTLPNNSIYSLAINGIGKNDIDASYLFNNYQNLNKITSLNITYNVTIKRNTIQKAKKGVLKWLLEEIVFLLPFF